ncbi:coiled-coil domain-containing protein 27-like isoform X2 [Alosa sapidissima]|uniref:coiled-coil domain-containing protein 27-like isoform X2 n=1 Tax=Alosa sapidissima TaxID=34773 RepID=UPI001C09FF32|nr:coiled-coil domain-containing protein 27-like isoform X2 [Alosa sapidissima]
MTVDGQARSTHSMRDEDKPQRPKTALVSGGTSRSRTIRPLLRQTCWAPHVPSTPHQTGEGPRHSAACKLLLDNGTVGGRVWGELGRCLIPPHKVGVSRLTQTSPNDPDTRQVGASEDKEGKTPWYVTLLKEKEQSLLVLANEISRLSEVESESVRKDRELCALRERLQDETQQLRRTHENVVRAQAELILDLTEEVRRLQSADKELQQKNQLVADLQQEVTCLREGSLSQKDQHASGIHQEDALHLQQEVTCRREDPSELEEPSTDEATALMEMETNQEPHQSEVIYSAGEEPSETRDELANAENNLIAALERANQTLKKELEEARTNHKMTSGTLCSMHRILSVKEHELLTVKTELQDMKKELKDRMTQLQTMSRKFSCLRDGKMRDELMMTLEKENYSLRHLVVRLQERLSQREQNELRMCKQVCELEEEVRAEKLQRSRLRKEAQVHEQLARELQLSINSSQVSLEQLQSKYERLRVKVIQAVYSAPGTKPPQKEISDAAIYYTMQKIIDDRSRFHQRLVQRGDKVPSLAISDAAPSSNVLGL